MTYQFRNDCFCEACFLPDPEDPLAWPMFLCKDCGNKRCPRAGWHGYECTKSNAPDQIATCAECGDDHGHMRADRGDECPEHEPIHAHFELSYASYLVLHRTVLQSMPVAWQRRFVRCLRELDAAMGTAGLEKPASYWVRPTDASGKFVRETLPHYRHAPNVLRQPKETP